MGIPTIIWFLGLLIIQTAAASHIRDHQAVDQSILTDRTLVTPLVDGPSQGS